MLTDKSIVLIGAGNMGEILIRGLIAGEFVTPDRVTAVEIHAERRQLIAERYRCRVSDDPTLAQDADIVVLAVKPQGLAEAIETLRDIIKPTQLVVSILAGIHTERIEAGFAAKIPVVRVMPNAPASVLEGASAIFAGKHAGERELALTRSIFEAVGKVVTVSHEALMDVVTGLSGSGPAFVFMMIEALSDAGVQLGLPRKVANMLAGQTVQGAAKMFLDTGKHAGELKDLVATPGGTTFAGLRALEKGIFRSTVMDAVEAATRRSIELGKI
ncbi:pyrroline-5-carboxylate reductase [bacterium]|nr:pyrroline-5-carboxylate reductase [bacterium]